MVLLEFATKNLVGHMRGIEAQARFRLAVVPEPYELSAPRYHEFLTAKCETFAAAAEYTRKLDGHIRDSAGREVAVIHKGATASRPPDVQRREQGTKEPYGLANKRVVGEEELVMTRD